jgi:hypothetical protein
MNGAISAEVTIGGRMVLATGQIVHREVDGLLEIIILGARMEFAYQTGSPAAIDWKKLTENELRVTFICNYQDYGTSYDIPDMFLYGGSPVSAAFYVNWAGPPERRTRQISYTFYL